MTLEETATAFVAAIQAKAGVQVAAFGIEPEDPNNSRILLLQAANYPMLGLSTCFTFGLSQNGHPGFSEGTAELMCVVNSEHPGWIASLGYLIDWYREQDSFVMGAMYDLGQELEPERSLLSGWVIGPNPLEADNWHLLETEAGFFELLGAYPIYSGEVELLQKVGLDKFSASPKYEAYNVERPDLSQLVQLDQL